MARIWIKDIIHKEGEQVELKGWVHNRRDHGKLIFIDLRDRSGLVQVVFLSKDKELVEKASDIRGEWVLHLKGTINRRPEKLVNPNITTGEFEVVAEDFEVLNKSETPPIDVESDGRDIGEDARMQHRYIDLRRERMRDNMIMRHRIIKYIRDHLVENDFIETETPILGKSTPEGARDYLVPSRLQPGHFYALPQSPQQYKQLLMTAGMERYFQIARCFRDEDTRGDRQPEFTQLDLEMSFTSQEEILGLMQELFLGLVKELYPEKTLTFGNEIPHLSYDDVMKEHNSDKPDLRKDKNDPNELAFAFVVDFPMFEWREKENRFDAVHHPFTRPKQKENESLEELVSRMNEDTANVVALQYDFVLNGYEIGGGSIRTHEPELLMEVFKIMGHTKEQVEEKFGHLLKAFSFGVPPHGGIAPGIDRIAMILQNEPNIREVIAFPKTGDGRDLMMGAPDSVSEEQLDDLHIRVVDQNKQDEE